jgi:hypothetical protein
MEAEAVSHQKEEALQQGEGFRQKHREVFKQQPLWELLQVRQQQEEQARQAWAWLDHFLL